MAISWYGSMLRNDERQLLMYIDQALIAVFTVFQAAILVLYAAHSSVRTPSSVAAAALVVADALGLLILSHAEHFRSLRPSNIINSYLFMTILFDIAAHPELVDSTCSETHCFSLLRPRLLSSSVWLLRRQ